jgi:hypothetical protein
MESESRSSSSRQHHRPGSIRGVGFTSANRSSTGNESKWNWNASHSFLSTHRSVSPMNEIEFTIPNIAYLQYILYIYIQYILYIYIQYILYIYIQYILYIYIHIYIHYTYTIHIYTYIHYTYIYNIYYTYIYYTYIYIYNMYYKYIIKNITNVYVYYGIYKQYCVYSQGSHRTHSRRPTSSTGPCTTMLFRPFIDPGR